MEQPYFAPNYLTAPLPGHSSTPCDMRACSFCTSGINSQVSLFAVLCPTIVERGIQLIRYICLNVFHFVLNKFCCCCYVLPLPFRWYSGVASGEEKRLFDQIYGRLRRLVPHRGWKKTEYSVRFLSVRPYMNIAKRRKKNENLEPLCTLLYSEIFALILDRRSQRGSTT